ncbi:MAG: DegT/DnrJ/EryC1/StrS family aminotransferase [Zoogloea oleivorans]|jgi:dTDP-4-amino-4,6-dideoxygalactose transaminase|uniref:DegT/DnrJ/EryC1/StrS family aminotransferase n=1 Tax=Zoogloea oleivorans TaxID=1552750 RepID=UPI002A36D2FD|nr:DegT/DnrJ/EryC1/StrS family aminotransferase [Zoogloea oleivorans]MDY0036824.1 DegT/DnrJ/EryC1/StrS family aminotransferase [Zoogloea oleivorans]
MITVTRSTLPPLDEYVAYLEGIWQSAHLTNNGPLCCELSTRLKSNLGVPRIELLANGTLALQLAIRALGLRGEIITTPYSYVATTNAILWEGCDPVFVDIEPHSFCIDPDLIEAAITGRSSAILATHVYGYPCNVERIQSIADRHGLSVIYDAAHAFGVRLGARSLLEYGDCSTLSFHATKLFHTVEGGGVVCRDAVVANRLFLMSTFGHTGEENYQEIGINAKMSELHAAMGLGVLPRVQEYIDIRRRCAGWYDQLLAGLPLQRPHVEPELEYNYAYYPVLFSSHEVMMQVRKALLEHDIVPRRYFYPSLNTLPFLRPELRRPCPISESVAGRVLALPLSTAVGYDDVCRIVALIRDTLEDEGPAARA